MGGGLTVAPCREWGEMNDQPDNFKGQDFERSLAGSDAAVAAFDSEQRDFVHRLQHMLHSSPAIVPLFVC